MERTFDPILVEVIKNELACYHRRDGDCCVEDRSVGDDEDWRLCYRDV